VKPPPFGYVRPRSLTEAAALLQSHGDGAQILAGGQSLLPTLSLRLSQPTLLIDINAVEDATPLEERDGTLRCGARVRHVELERSELTHRRAPLLAMAMPQVAHVAIRNRGTPCGSVALADPAAEIPACVIALRGDVVLQGSKVSRIVAAEDFFLGLYETARGAAEVISELRFPIAEPDDRFGFAEFTRRLGDFAIVGIAAAAHLEDRHVVDLRFVVFGCEARPKLSAVARELANGCACDAVPIERIAKAVASEIDPMSNAQGDARSKRLQTRALSARVLTHMFAGEAA